eukprot:jgi/Botrbrau1/12642/Bobra.67_1s0008.1
MMQSHAASAMFAVARYQQSSVLDSRIRRTPFSHVNEFQRRRKTSLGKRQRTTQEGRKYTVHSEPLNNEVDSNIVGEIEVLGTEANTFQEGRADDVLPDNLSGALAQAASATQRAMERGVLRCQVELLLPELWDPNSGALFAEEGDQQRFWKLTRRFVMELADLSSTSVRALYPDTGVAAMLRNQWQDANFGIGAISDRVPFREDEQIIVLAAPDPQGLAECKAVAAQATEYGKVVILFNPRLASGDVGIGLNVRRMRDQFLSTFTTTYSLCPIGDIGTVFRCYPSMWQVFVEDPESPGRYRLAAERPSRPAGEALDTILMESSLGEGGRTGKMEGQASSTSCKPP